MVKKCIIVYKLCLGYGLIIFFGFISTTMVNLCFHFNYFYLYSINPHLDFYLSSKILKCLYMSHYDS